MEEERDERDEAEEREEVRRMFGAMVGLAYAEENLRKAKALCLKWGYIDVALAVLNTALIYVNRYPVIKALNALAALSCIHAAYRCFKEVAQD